MEFKMKLNEIPRPGALGKGQEKKIEEFYIKMKAIRWVNIPLRAVLSPLN